jgi:hypothetical protein
MSNFFLGPNFSQKIAMGVKTPIIINSQESESNQEIKQDKPVSEETDQKKIKGEKYGKES